MVSVVIFPLSFFILFIQFFSYFFLLSLAKGYPFYFSKTPALAFTGLLYCFFLVPILFLPLFYLLWPLLFSFSTWLLRFLIHFQIPLNSRLGCLRVFLFLDTSLYHFKCFSAFHDTSLILQILWPSLPDLMSRTKWHWCWLRIWQAFHLCPLLARAPQGSVGVPA